MAAAQGAGFGFQAANSVGSGYVQAKSQRDQADYQLKVAELNNKTIDYQIERTAEQADDAIKRGNQAVSKRTQQERLQVGAARAEAAAGGGDVNSGSVETAISDIETVSATDMANLKTNAWQEAYGFKSEAIALKAQQNNNTMGARTSANALRYAAKTSMINGWVGGVSGALSAAGTAKGNSKPSGSKGSA